MDNYKTVPIQSVQQPQLVEKSTCNTLLEVNYNQEDGSPVTKIFSEKFTIGRNSECDIIFLSKNVSRLHVELHPGRTRWIAHDLKSTNSTYLDGKVIMESPLPNKCILQLGNEGPALMLQQYGNKVNDGKK